MPTPLLRSVICLGMISLAACADAHANLTTRYQQALSVDEIDAYVLEEMRSERIPGLALVIVRGTEIVHTWIRKRWRGT